jgi:hypothetical protein
MWWETLLYENRISFPQMRHLAGKKRSKLRKKIKEFQKHTSVDKKKSELTDGA